MAFRRLPPTANSGVTLLREIWAILSPPQRRAVLAMQLVSLLVACSTTVGVASIAPFFAVLGDPRLIRDQPWLNRLYAAGGFASEHSFLIALALGFVSALLLANLISLLGFIAMHRVARAIGNQLQTRLFAVYLGRPYAYHAGTSSVALLNKVIYETVRFTHGILENGFTFITSLVTAVLIFASIVLVNTAVAGVLLVVLVGGYALIYLGVRGRLMVFGEVQSRLACQQAQIVGESFGAIKEITVLQAQGFFGARFAQLSGEFLRAATYSQLIAQAPRHLMECTAAAGIVAGGLVLGSRSTGLADWLGPLTFSAFAAYRLLPALQQMFAALVRIRADRAALRNIAPDLQRTGGEQPVASPDPPLAQPKPPPLWAGGPRQGICVKNLWFRYSAERPWVLSGLSMRIPAGVAAGIVGANGSGKSTFMDLLAGLLAPGSGSIEIDGVALHESNQTSWQQCIAYVPQNVFLLNASIAENIALGTVASSVDGRRLEEVVRLAQLEELLATLPQGLAQPVGERGIALSGGQRQRLGIARALYRTCSVLLLDEATSGLDGLSERDLLSTLAALRGRCTVVLVSHRSSVIRACDVLFEFAQGGVRATGTYEGLMRGSRDFRRLAGER